LGYKVGLTLLMHHVFGVGLIGILIASATELFIENLKQRIMKTLKKMNFKKILGGALSESSIMGCHPG
jgi:hypothetical protein